MYLGSQKSIFGAVSTRGKLNPQVPWTISSTSSALFLIESKPSVSSWQIWCTYFFYSFRWPSICCICMIDTSACLHVWRHSLHQTYRKIQGYSLLYIEWRNSEKQYIGVSREINPGSHKKTHGLTNGQKCMQLALSTLWRHGWYRQCALTLFWV